MHANSLINCLCKISLLWAYIWRYNDIRIILQYITWIYVVCNVGMFVYLLSLHCSVLECEGILAYEKFCYNNSQKFYLENCLTDLLQKSVSVEQKPKERILSDSEQVL